MRKFLFLFIFLFIVTNFNGQKTLEGKSFRLKTSQTCKDQIGTLTYYKNFEFKKGKVLIYDNVVASVIKEREHTYDFLNDNKKILSYKWKMIGNKIIIKDYRDFDSLTYKDEKIYAYKEDKIFELFPFIQK